MTYLNGVLFHGQWPWDTVELIVQAACIADGLSGGIAAPQRSVGGVAVGAGKSGSL